MAEAKTGWRCTEFWLSTIATIVGLVMASGATDNLAEGSWIPRIIGGVVAVLAALGYTASRAKVKSGV